MPVMAALALMTGFVSAVMFVTSAVSAFVLAQARQVGQGERARLASVALLIGVGFALTFLTLTIVFLLHAPS